MTKEEIKSGLNEKFEGLFQWVESQSDELFEVAIEGKWSPGQHVDHLIKSTAPLNQALGMPKLALRTMFGKNNREERTYDGVVAKYTEKIQAGGVAAGRFVPKTIGNGQKQTLINDLKSERDKLLKLIDKWNDKHMAAYVVPHPLIGKMTINEILYFTIYHTGYHLDLLKRDYPG